MLTYGWRDAIRAYRETDHRFGKIPEPELEVHDWIDGTNSYDPLVKIRLENKVSFGDFPSGRKRNVKAMLSGQRLEPNPNS
ncbi:hypothetical protein ANAEL_04929 [Anaerolineales bacterium]|nr:hypothetical protein ANAEL_04929 [Anaerolineales bacterium]